MSRADVLKQVGKEPHEDLPDNLQGYPVAYWCADGGVLCARCANCKEVKEAEEECPGDKQWLLIGHFGVWEESETCDHCGTIILPAYG